MMKFLYSTATCSTISHIVLEEAGAAFTGMEVSWKRKVNVEELEKTSSLGTVPALVVNGKVLTQNAAILEFIADSHPESQLLAKPGTFERAETMSWVAFVAAEMHKGFGPILMPSRMTTSEPAQQELKANATANMLKYLSHIDASLNGKDFIMGRQYTVADAALFVCIGWCKWAEIKTSPYKNINSYMRRIYQRPAVQKVLKAEGLLDYLQD